MNIIISNKFPLLLFCLSLTLTTVIYALGLHGGFWLDDYNVIVNNGYLKLNELTWQNLKAAIFSFQNGNYRPVAMLSFALNSYFFDLSPFSLKSINLLIHLINGIGLYIFTTLILKTAGHKHLLKTIDKKYIPLILTTLWLLSPINLTSVLYAVQRMASLSCLFMIYGCIIYFLGRQHKNDYLSKILIAVSFLIFTPLAYYSKENGILLIPLLFLIEILFFKFKTVSNNLSKGLIALYVVTLAIPIIMIIALLIYDPAKLIGTFGNRDFTAFERLLTQFRVLWFYIFMTIAPINSKLSLWHDDYLLSTSLVDPITTIISALGLIFALIFAIVKAKKNPLICFAIFWFFICHSIESSIFNLELVYEHRNYLASYGMLLGVLVTIDFICSQLKLYKLSIIFVLAFALYLTFILFLRAQLWGTPLEHAIFEANNHPESPRALQIAGSMIINSSSSFSSPALAKTQGLNLLAESSKYDKLTFIADACLLVLSDKLSLPHRGRYIKEILLKLTYQSMISSNLSSLSYLRSCYENSECTTNPKEILPIFESAATQNNAKAKLELARFLSGVLNETEKSIPYLNEAISITPNESAIYGIKAKYLFGLGRTEEAKENLKLAKKYDKAGLYREQIKNLLNRVN